MGTWRIEVTGHGCHHNKNPQIDADLATRDFVETLKRQGHTNIKATFQITGGDPEDVSPNGPEVKEWRQERLASPWPHFFLDGKKHEHNGSGFIRGADVRARLSPDKAGLCALYFENDSMLGKQISDGDIIPSGERIMSVPPAHA